MLSRRERLEAMLAEQPADAFLRYGLAIEWAKEGEIERSLVALAQLTQQMPPYVPAFFRSGQVLCELGRIDEARTVLRDGIEAARAQGDFHAAGEMSELLMALGNEAPG